MGLKVVIDCQDAESHAPITVKGINIEELFGISSQEVAGSKSPFKF